MHKKISKAIAGSVMAAAMAASTAAMFIAPMTASAGDMLGQSNFDDGIGLPWHTCETNPAKQTFDIEGGTYNVHIENNQGGNGRWDLQLRHRGLSLKSGHKYHIHAEITCDEDGWIYSKIGNYAGDKEIWHNLGAGDWQPIQLKAGKTLVVDDTFTSNTDMEVAEWAFHYSDGHFYSGHTDTGCPDGATISFDNLELECTTCGDTYTEGSCNFDKTNEFGVITPRSNVRLNQVGYYPNLAKQATYVTEATSPLNFEVRDKSGKAVYTGKTKPMGYDKDANYDYETCHLIDFTEFDETGTDYTIFVEDTKGITQGTCATKASGDKLQYTNQKTGVTYTVNVSHPFDIGDTILDGALSDAVNYFYQNRSGIKIESTYITSGDKTKLAHPAGHTTDSAYVQSKWVKSYSGDFDGDKSYSVDGVGGWYDAGDHGKYVVNGGISVWTLQNMYEFAVKNGNGDKFTGGKVHKIPETGSNPDILEECKWELDWMFKMIVTSKDPYWSKDAGLVYHKLHDHKWTGLATEAWNYEEDWGTTRIVKPPTFAATYNVAACAAQAARLWGALGTKEGDAYAQTCLDNAKLCYEAAQKLYYELPTTTGNYCDDYPEYAPLDQAIGGGGYGDTYVEDDAYWAACELYATTGDTSYYNDLMKYQNAAADDKALSITTSLGGGENNGSFSSFNWGCTAGLGTLSLYLSGKLDSKDQSTVEKAIVTAADTYIAQEAKSGMGIPYVGATFEDAINIGAGIKVTGYEWGSNSFVINNAIVMAYAYDIEGTNKYISGASTALDYILGRNGNGFSYVSGYGDYTMTYPHHRYWCQGVDKEFPLAPDGVMSGGPGAGMQDPYIGGLGYKRGTLASQKCYVDNAESWSTNEVTINWNSPFAWVVSFLEDEAPDAPAPGEDPTGKTDPTSGDVLYGDADCDGTVAVNDAVLILQSLANPTKYSISAQGKINGDCNKPGAGLDAEDALAIQKACADLVTLPIK